MKIREAIEMPVKFAAEQLLAGASIGYACAPADGCTLKDLLRAADERIYVDKSARRSSMQANRQMPPSPATTPAISASAGCR